MSMGAFMASDYVETRMEEIFRLAYLWGCILLLDEADVFLTARSASMDSGNRNEVVSSKILLIQYSLGA